MPRHSSLAFSVDSASTESQALQRGAVVGDFRIEQLIRRGSAGYVYRARDLFMQRDVVLKEYFPAHLARRKPDGGLQVFLTDAETFAASKNLFMMEAIQLSRMNHASVAKVNRVWEAGSTAYVTMPLYQGRMLDEACALGEIVPTVAWVEQFVRPLLDFVGSLHRRSIHGVELSVGDVMLLEGRYPLIMSLGPRFSRREALDDSPVVPPQPWSDVQALARMVLEIIAPSMGKIQYPRSWISSLQDTASGVPGRRAANVFELMKFSGLDDRRSRARVQGESALIEVGHDSQRGLLDVVGSGSEVTEPAATPATGNSSVNPPTRAVRDEPADWAATTFTALYFDQPEVAAAQAQAQAQATAEAPALSLAVSKASTPSASVVELPARRTARDELDAAEQRSSPELANRYRTSADVEHPQSPSPAAPSVEVFANRSPRLRSPSTPVAAPPAVVSPNRPATLVDKLRRHWATLAFALIVLLLVANLVATLRS